jgi:hypothetical protein
MAISGDPVFEPRSSKEPPDYKPAIILVCEAIGTAATPGLLCQPRVIVKVIVEKQMECRLAREAEVLGKNLPQRHFCPSQNPTLPDPGWKPDRRGGKPTTNRLSYGAAYANLCTATFNVNIKVSLSKLLYISVTT